MSFEWFAAAILMAWMLDWFLGDPMWLPHPVVAFGQLIARVEKLLNRGKHRITKGAVAVFVLVGGCFGLFYGVDAVLYRELPWVWLCFVLIFVFYGLANRTLIREGRAVFSVLRLQGVEAGRQQLSRIVGRDTSLLTPNQIRTAVLETMSENLSDGVVAPLFWLALGGVPGMMAYKMVNTLDSMWGYRSERFLLFGRVAARLDDVANYLPARLTGLLMALVSGSWRSIQFMRRYGRSHKSPNSGYPESALAGILDCRFGGPAVYHGQLVEKPYIGTNDRPLDDRDVAKAARINHLVCFLMVWLVIGAWYCQS